MIPSAPPTGGVKKERRREMTYIPQGVMTAHALHDDYVRKVNEALEHGREDEAIALAGLYAHEMGFVRAA
jgi:hypothetical protein